MDIKEKTINTAQSYEQFDEAALLVILGKQEKAIERDATLAGDPALNPFYDGTHMGAIEDLKTIGKRILRRWSKELHKIVCATDDNQSRDDLVKALNLGEAAAIASVVSLLLAIATPPAIAAPLAVLLVKSLLLPAKDELCAAWTESLQA